MTDRRYSKEEVEEIFARAADAQENERRGETTSTGLTLREMQEIGAEAGIEPDAVARAAAGLARHSPDSVSGSMLGFPIRVGETAELGRLLTDDEWERAVVMLRQTFKAQGRLGATGSFRQWTNGNLQALLEPGENGHRLRLQTFNQQSRGLMGIGVATVVFGVATAAIAAINGALSTDSVERVAGLFLVGASFFAAGAARLPSWARTRRRQMREIIERLRDQPSSG